MLPLVAGGPYVALRDAWSDAQANETDGARNEGCEAAGGARHDHAHGVRHRVADCVDLNHELLKGSGVEHLLERRGTRVPKLQGILTVKNKKERRRG